MCGIIGMTLFNAPEDQKNRKKRIKVLRNVLYSTIENSISRGKDATGIAYVTNDVWRCIKGPMDAEDLFRGKHQEKKKTVRDFTKEWDSKYLEQTIHVLGHVRAATQGDIYGSENNHPLIMEEEDGNTVIGIHNGVLVNDSEVTKEYSLTRSAEVDSEVLFRLARHLSKNPDGFDKESHARLGAIIRGSFAILSFTTMEPNKLWLASTGRPLKIFFIPQVSAAFYISESKFLEKAIAEHNRTFWKNSTEIILTYEKLDYKEDNMYMCISADKQVTCAKEIPDFIEEMNAPEKSESSKHSGNAHSRIYGGYGHYSGWGDDDYCYPHTGQPKYKKEDPIEKESKALAVVAKQQEKQENNSEPQKATLVVDAEIVEDGVGTEKDDKDSPEASWETDVDFDFNDLVDEGIQLACKISNAQDCPNSETETLDFLEDVELFDQSPDKLQIIHDLEDVLKESNLPESRIEAVIKDMDNMLDTLIEVTFGQGYACANLYEGALNTQIRANCDMPKNKSRDVEKMKATICKLDTLLRAIVSNGKRYSYKQVVKSLQNKMTKKEIKRTLSLARKYSDSN